MQTRFRLTVKRGVEYAPMTGLSQYELSSRIETLREWFDLDADDLAVEVESVEREGADHAE